MTLRSFGSGRNLPPGVYESQIPGNRPEDAAFDHAFDRRDCKACEWYDKCEKQHNDDMTCGLWKCVEDASKFTERLEYLESIIKEECCEN